jgi:hypothetical protein
MFLRKNIIKNLLPSECVDRDPAILYGLEHRSLYQESHIAKRKHTTCVLRVLLLRGDCAVI